MIQVCYSKYHIGDRKYGEKEPFSDRSETHGVCSKCWSRELRYIRREYKKYKERQRILGEI
jgi:hypothetical protein